MNDKQSMSSLLFRVFRSAKRRALALGLRPIQKRLDTQKFRRLLESDTIKLNLGSGPAKGVDGWTNIDLRDADINWNLTAPFPLPSSCVDCIYTSHLLEHFGFSEICKFLTELHRILKPGSTLKICVPDSRKYIQAYDRKINFRKDEELYAPAICDTGSFIDQVNYIAYMGGEHKFMFDSENLSSLLTRANFINVVERRFDPNIDNSERQIDSLYVSAQKS